MTSEGTEGTTKGTEGTDTEGLSDMLHLSFYKKIVFNFIRRMRQIR